MKWLKHIWNKLFHRSPGRRRLNITNCSLGYPVSGSDAEIDAYMEKLINKTKKVPYLDVSGSCGDYNLRFNLADMAEEVWIPVREEELSGSL